MNLQQLEYIVAVDSYRHFGKAAEKCLVTQPTLSLMIRKLEEGHCFRSQILNLCKLRKASEQDKHFDYEAGSIETLKKMVEWNEGITILPELALLHLSKEDLQMVRRFKSPAPVREVSIVTHKDFGNPHLAAILAKEILQVIPGRMKKTGKRRIIQVQPAK